MVAQYFAVPARQADNKKPGCQQTGCVSLGFQLSSFKKTYLPHLQLLFTQSLHCAMLISLSLSRSDNQCHRSNEAMMLLLTGQCLDDYIRSGNLLRSDDHRRLRSNGDRNAFLLLFSRSVAIMALLCLHCEGCVVCQSSADGSVAPNSGGPVECHSQLVQERSLHPLYDHTS